MTGPSRPRGVLVARLVGVPVVVRPLWFVWAAYLILTGQALLRDRYGSLAAYGLAAALVLMVLASVLLHEAAHCLTARAFGLPVRSITVGVIAGMTDIAKPPRSPMEEYSVAMSGPMVSVLLTAVGVAGAAATDGSSQTWLMLAALAVTNGLLAAMNLLPGLPLDGGRILRSLLWARLGDGGRATLISARAGMVLGTLVVPVLIVVALPAAGFGKPGVASVLTAGVVGTFLYVGAAMSLRQEHLLQRVPALSVDRLARPALGVSGSVPLSEAVRQAHEASLHALVVLDGNGAAQGVVSEAWVKQVPWERRPWVTVAEGAARLQPGAVLAPTLAGQELLDALQQFPATEYLVSGEPARVLVAADVRAALAGRPIS